MPTATIHAWIPLNTPDAETDAFDGRRIAVLKPQWGRVNSAAEGLRIFDQPEDGPRRLTPDFANQLRAQADAVTFFVGGRWPAIEPILIDPSAARNALDTLVTLAHTYGCGVEIDFEGYDQWTPAAWLGYGSFLTALGNRLHAIGQTLSVDLPPLTGPDDRYLLTYAALEPLPIDLFIPMCYDYQHEFGAGQPLAPIDWTLDVFRWITNEIGDPARIAIGIPNYGYIARPNRLTVNSKSEIATMLNGDLTTGFQRDPASLEWFADIDGVHYRYTDAVGLTEKRRQLESLGCKNIAVWHLGGGNDWFLP